MNEVNNSTNEVSNSMNEVNNSTNVMSTSMNEVNKNKTYIILYMFKTMNS